jgi:transcriptional regulator with XRE-family HTH domain
MRGLRKIRLSKGIRLEHVVADCSVNIATLSAIERGEQVPSTKTRIALERYFDESINWLDVPRLSDNDPVKSNWLDCEKDFRSLCRRVVSLPTYQKIAFILSSIRHLRKLMK